MAARPLPSGGRRRIVAGLVAALALAVAGGCGGDDDNPAENGLDAGAFTAVLREVVPPSGDDTTPVVYVWAPVDPALSLEDQTHVIDDFGDGYDLRFVDDVAAALDEEEPGRPPRDDGMLIGIGAVTTEIPIEVRVEVYRTDDQVIGHRFTLSQRDDTWTVVGDAAVEPEMLGDDV